MHLSDPCVISKYHVNTSNVMATAYTVKGLWELLSVYHSLDGMQQNY